jgi:hypothetical protein
VYTLPTKPEPIGVVLDDAVELYRQSFRSCWVLSLGGTLLTLALRLRMDTGMPKVTLSGRGTQAIPDIVNALQQVSRSGSLLNDLLLVAVSLLLYGALFDQMNRVAHGRDPRSLLDAVVTALRRLPGMALAAAVWFVAVFVGMFLFLIPGIILWGKLEFWIAAAFADDVGAIGGLGRSWELTKGKWWRSVTAVSVALVMVVVLGSAGDVCAGLLLAFTHTDLASVLLVTQLMQSVANIFVLPMIPAATLAIYYDMKLRRDGGDLLDRANSVQSA